MGDKKDIEKRIKRFAITKQLNVLIGSGASCPAIPLMGAIKASDENERNDNLTKKIIEQSENLIKGLFVDEDEIDLTLNNYTKFINAIIELLNLANSRQTPKSVNIFTTNYDLFIEKAIDELSRQYKFVFNDGTNGYFERYLDSTNYNKVVAYKGLNDNYIDELPSINLIKPHGSVNWMKMGDKILVDNKVVKKPVIVKPTGLEEEETFLNNHFHEMLRVFQLELDKPQSLLLILGFSFQDKHIAKMVKRAMKNPELMIYVFGYSDSDRTTYLNNLGLERERNNFKIITPKDVEKNILIKNKNDKGEDTLNFTLQSLTKILNVQVLEEPKDEE